MPQLREYIPLTANEKDAVVEFLRYASDMYRQPKAELADRLADLIGDAEEVALG